MRTPRPTKEEKTPRPTVTYLQPTPKPTVGGGWGAPAATEPCPVARCDDPCSECGANDECVTERTWFDDAHRCPACDELVECKVEDGWGTAMPLSGCAANVAKADCKEFEECTWKSGYPPLAFSEDSDYMLHSEESFFANMDNSVVNMIDNMDSNMLMAAGVVFVAVLLIAMRQCMVSKKKVVVDANVNMDYGSLKA